jgi:hypothetical protein
MRVSIAEFNAEGRNLIHIYENLLISIKECLGEARNLLQEEEIDEALFRYYLKHANTDIIMVEKTIRQTRDILRQYSSYDFVGSVFRPEEFETAEDLYRTLQPRWKKCQEEIFDQTSDEDSQSES